MNRKVKGEKITKIIWILGALFFGVYSLLILLSIRNPDEDLIDCLRQEIEMLSFFLVYVVGVIYLFNGNRKFAVASSYLYVVSYGLKMIIEFTEGSQISIENMMTLILHLIAYFVFALFIRNIVYEEKNDLSLKYLKYWYLPAILLFIAGFSTALWTEFIRPDGFLWDGLILDLSVAVIENLPIFSMSLIVRERTLTRITDQNKASFNPKSDIC